MWCPGVLPLVLAFVPLLVCDGDPADPGDDVAAGVLEISSTSATWAGDAAASVPDLVWVLVHVAVDAATGRECG